MNALTESLFSLCDCRVSIYIFFQKGSRPKVRCRHQNIDPPRNYCEESDPVECKGTLKLYATPIGSTALSP